jgi:hypothetical protein
MKTELLKLIRIMDEWVVLGGMVQPQARAAAEGDFDGININALDLFVRGPLREIERTDLDWDKLQEEVADLNADIEREFFE